MITPFRQQQSSEPQPSTLLEEPDHD